MHGLEEPYKKRPIRYLGLWELIGWRMKAYSIAYGRDTVRGELVDAARRVALERISRTGESQNHYGAGFIGMHEGKNGNFVFIDWWADENELHHHVYTSSLDQPGELTYMTPTGLAACTWDLRLVCFEREAWVASVLEQYPEPDIDRYLATTLDTLA